MAFISFSSGRNVANLNDPESIKRFPWKTFLVSGVSVPLIFVLLGGYFIYQDYTRSNTWADASATVTRSEIIESYGDSGLMYSPVVEYTYTVNDTVHKGSLGNWGSTSLRSSVENIVNKYQVGATVPVKVDPNDPSASALPGEISIVWYIFLIAGIAFMIIFVWVGLVFRKKQQALLNQEKRPQGYTIH
ncbi:DUF3592 domain-containing protein [Candidatus Uhrbacteria bacterium]|nr:DUF3592 domain-containing protein [Candidatus Uhrbacteria bacterium]